MGTPPYLRTGLPPMSRYALIEFPRGLRGSRASREVRLEGDPATHIHAGILSKLTIVSSTNI